MMLEEMKEHLQNLRQIYNEATFEQRYDIALQRVDEPNCYPNQLCNIVAAVEGIARTIMLQFLVLDGEAVGDAYEKVCHKRPTQLLKMICEKQETDSKVLFGENWDVFELAEKYRNLLVHECTFLREEYAILLLDACRNILQKLSEIKK